MLRHIRNFVILFSVLTTLPIAIAVLIAALGKFFVFSLLLGCGLPLLVLPLYGELVGNGRIEKLDSLGSIQRVYILALGMRNTRSRATWKLKKLAERETDTFRRAAIAKFARRMIKLKMCWAKLKPKKQPWATDDVSTFLPALAATQPAWEASFLEQIVGSELTAVSRSKALERVAELKGVGSIDYLLGLLDEPALNASAVRAIASLGPAAATPECVDRLRKQVADSKDTWVVSATAQALISIGHGDDPVLQAHLDKFTLWTRFVVRLKARAISAKDLVERLFEAGVVGADRRDRVKTATVNRLRILLDRGEGYVALHSLLTKLQSVHDVESKHSDEFERFPEYLKELGKIATPRLKFEDVFIDREVFRFRVCNASVQMRRHNGCDWFDVLETIDLVLCHSDRPERLAALEGDIGHVILGTESGLVGLIADLEVPISFLANSR